MTAVPSVSTPVEASNILLASRAERALHALPRATVSHIADQLEHVADSPSVMELHMEGHSYRAAGVGEGLMAIFRPLDAAEARAQDLPVDQGAIFVADIVRASELTQ